ncbi:phage portal protein [Solidesulfovibrio alcoholivorans]|uniref:phage portal protein n=1 Tax=Solidesulfovibrio alcoholivorans TaxID=81406 RepID=UPI0006936BE7|nr:phage portal protein [Solidesulfovibrio alcoholivorans]
MSFFDFFRPKKRSFDTLSEFGLGLPTATGQTVTVDGSLALPAVFVCVRVLAESIGSMPLHIYRRASNGDRQAATDHPLHKLFRFAPNSYQTSLEAREFLTACVAMRGNAYAYIDRQDGMVAGVWPLHPARVQVIVDGTVIQYRYSDEKGQTFLYDQEEVLHLKGLSTDGIMGLSPISTLKETIGASQALEQYQNKFFANAARPSGVLTHPGQLTPDAGTRLREQWDGLYSGSANRGKTIVLEEGMTWQAIGLTNEDAQLLESRRFNLQDILRVYRIPGHIAGDLSKASYNNIETLGSEFLNLTLSPWLKRIEERMNLQLLTEGEREAGYYFEHDASGLLKGGVKERYESYQVGLAAGFLSVDEVRQWENLPAMPADVSKGVSPTDAP